MGNDAFIFPGQGAQKPKMGKEFFDLYECARNVFLEADEILSFNLSKLIFEGSSDDLRPTDVCQVALFVTSMAIHTVIEHEFPDLVPTMCAGLSLGEYSALCASQKGSFQTVLPIVAARGKFMNEDALRIKTTMAAVLGLDEEIIENCGYHVANLNCPGQVVIAGTIEEIEKAKTELKEKGAKRVIELSVAGAFHSPYMEKAKEKLTFFLSNLELVDSEIELAMNAVGHFVYDLDEIRSLLVEQVVKPTLWQDCIVTIDDRAPTCYYEIGPSQLAAMNKKIGVKSPTIGIETVKDLEEIHESVKG